MRRLTHPYQARRKTDNESTSKETATGTPWDQARDKAARQTSESDRASLSGAQWLALQQSISAGASFVATLRACAEVMSDLKPQLRALLNYHCGVSTLRTRQMMIDLQSLQAL